MLRDLLTRLQTGAESSRALVEDALARADGGAAAHVFTLRLDEVAHAQAEAADLMRAAGVRAPLLGVPITIKDNFDLAGHATTAGSRLLRSEAPATSDAPVVARLKQAGAIVLGRTNMTEFAFSGLGLNPHYGTPVNPAFADALHIPGGSSSGAAVSVALGIGSAALGTDTGGSIRIPAAFCGLVGFKPTAAAVSTHGVLPLSTTLDSVGVIARSVADCATVFDVVREAPRATRNALPPHRLRLGVVEETYVRADAEPAVEKAFAEALARLAAAGMSVEPIAIPELAAIPAMMKHGTLPGAEAYAWHEPWLAARREGDYDPRVVSRIKAGGAMSAAAYIRLLEQRRWLIDAVASRAAGLDALLWPTVPFIAPTIASLEADDAAYQAANLLALRNSTVVNLIDGCAVSLPCPTVGAPVGLTVAALRGRDDHLLSVAATIESILGAA